MIYRKTTIYPNLRKFEVRLPLNTGAAALVQEVAGSQRKEVSIELATMREVSDEVTRFVNEGDYLNELQQAVEQQFEFDGIDAYKSTVSGSRPTHAGQDIPGTFLFEEFS